MLGIMPRSTLPAHAGEFDEILAQQAIHTVFQPIISLKDGEVLGYEALSRGPQGSALEMPSALFALAEELGLTWELEYTCRRLAIERYARFQCDKLLFLNVNPHIIQDPRFHEGMTKAQLAQLCVSSARVVLELTEKTAITNYLEFYSILEHYKAQGFRLAVDDAGSGYSGLNLICHVKPKFLKQDMSLVRNIHRDAFKQQMMKFSVDFARATEIALVAEGIEDEAELFTLIDLGVEYAQGFYLCRPQPTLCAPSAELVEKMRASHRRRLEHRLKNVTTAHVGDFCRTKDAYPSSTPCSRIDQMFIDNETLMGLPIVDDGKPVGLVMREKFYTRMGRQYGYSLFHNRPISSIMDTHSLIVDFKEPLEVVAQAATQRDQLWLYDNIIVTINGQYFGIVTVMDLLQHITEQGIKYATYSNPLTGLPGNIIIERAIDRVMEHCAHYSVLYIDLDNFKAYNDVYGFKRGDEVLKLTAELLQQTFPETLFANSFVGHIGGDDFVVVLEETVQDEPLQAFIEQFDAKVLTYYDEVHVAEGGITSSNRRGELESFPIMSVSLAVVTDENGPFSSYHAVAKRATEVKKLCKAVQGSCVQHDRRV